MRKFASKELVSADRYGTPAAIGTAASVGTSREPSAADHVHPLTLTTAMLGSGIYGTDVTDIAAATSNGSSSTLARSNHAHKIPAGHITNAMVNATAAIAYSKLALTGSIVNADISASAAIAYSKLNLASSIVNADVSASAAIAASKIAAGTFGSGNYAMTGSLTTGTTGKVVLSESATNPYTATITVDDTGLKIGHNSAVRDLELQVNGTTKLTIDTSGNTTVAGLLKTGTTPITITTAAGYLVPTAVEASGTWSRVLITSAVGVVGWGQINNNMLAGSIDAEGKLSPAGSASKVLVTNASSAVAWDTITYAMLASALTSAGTPTTVGTSGGSASTGTGQAYARDDHSHVLAAGTIVDADINSSAAIAASKIATGTFGGSSTAVFPSSVQQAWPASGTPFFGWDYGTGPFNAGIRLEGGRDLGIYSVMSDSAGDIIFYTGTSGSGTARMTIAAGGSVSVVGALSKGSGSFLIPHPDPSKKGWELRHSFVESPTRGDNLYRFTVRAKKSREIVTFNLPIYSRFLNENLQVWVNGPGQSYGWLSLDEAQVSVQCAEPGDYNVLVIGTRKDPIAKNGFDRYGVEYHKERYANRTA